MTTHRQPTGIPAGGQFATSGRPEPLFTLDATGEPQAPLVLHAIGFNDDQTACDRCGRVELKGTVVLADDDGNEVSRMGTSCAGRTLGVQVTRSGALNRERIRRSAVWVELREADRLAQGGRFAFAAERLRDGRRVGLHRKDELVTAADLHDRIQAGLAARTDRWGVISRPGRLPAEVDTFAEAQAAATAYARFGGQVVRLRGDQWVHTAA